MRHLALASALFITGCAGRVPPPPTSLARTGELVVVYGVDDSLDLVRLALYDDGRLIRRVRVGSRRWWEHRMWWIDEADIAWLEDQALTLEMPPRGERCWETPRMRREAAECPGQCMSMAPIHWRRLDMSLWRRSGKRWTHVMDESCEHEVGKRLDALAAEVADGDGVACCLSTSGCPRALPPCIPKVQELPTRELYPRNVPSTDHDRNVLVE